MTKVLLLASKTYPPTLQEAIGLMAFGAVFIGSILLESTVEKQPLRGLIGKIAAWLGRVFVIVVGLLMIYAGVAVLSQYWHLL